MRKLLMLSRAWTLLILLVAAWSVPSSGLGQVRIPPEAVVNHNRLDDAIRQGQLLEQERRWGDALTHYEGALRNHPGRQELRRRLAVARAHLDVARRYADQSFLVSIERLTEQQSLDLFAEVLLKVETYHVHEPSWSQLIRRGIANFEIAATEPAFIDRYPQPVSTGYAHSAAQALQSAVGTKSIRNRHQARDAAASAARVAARQFGVPPQATILEFTCAAASSLDHYSSYLTGDQLDEVFSQIEGNFVGLGIELTSESESLLIVNVIPKGPADLAGMRPDDRIVEVDGKSMQEVSTDRGADMLKGPEFSYVEIVIQSPKGDLRKLKLQRRRVDVPSVQDAKIIDRQSGVAYLNLTSFQKTTSRDVDNALWALHRQGMRALIVDVRRNPGGLLNASVEVADKFLPAGTIVSTRGRSDREDFDYQAHSVGTWRVPLVVMIDRDSASASEIFAGAIRDHNRGTVVGQRSYGKGSVQGIFPLSRYKSGIRLTTAKFYSPSGQPISNHGVTPNILVQRDPPRVTAKPTENGQVLSKVDADPTLTAAIAAARRAVNYQVRRAN